MHPSKGGDPWSPTSSNWTQLPEPSTTFHSDATSQGPSHVVLMDLGGQSLLSFLQVDFPLSI